MGTALGRTDGGLSVAEGWITVPAVLEGTEPALARVKLTLSSAPWRLVGEVVVDASEHRVVKGGSPAYVLIALPECRIAREGRAQSCLARCRGVVTAV